MGQDGGGSVIPRCAEKHKDDHKTLTTVSLLLSILVSLDKVVNLSMPQFPRIKNENKDSHLMGGLRIR